MTRRPPALASVLAVTLAASLVAGCSGDDDPPAPDPAPTSSAADAPAEEAPSMTTRASIRKVTGGRLTPRQRTTLRGNVVATVDDWFDAAYLGGDYPRTDFDDAFGAFTAGAGQRARRDRKLMSNAAVGTTTYAVRATARRVVIDVLAVGGRPAGATVQFRLGLARAGESGDELRERVSGHLYLTYETDRGWRVFGYDVGRGAI